MGPEKSEGTDVQLSFAYIDPLKLIFVTCMQLTGDMLGTFMAWLNDVDAGGFTAFDRPGMITIDTTCSATD